MDNLLFSKRRNSLTILKFVLVITILLSLLPTSIFTVTSANSLDKTEMLDKLLGVWEGYYNDSQKDKAFTCTVFKESDIYKGIFEFYNMLGQDNGEYGSFYVNIGYDTVRNIYTFTSYAWIVQPADYMYYDAEGILDGDILHVKLKLGWLEKFFGFPDSFIAYKVSENKSDIPEPPISETKDDKSTNVNGASSWAQEDIKRADELKLIPANLYNNFTKNIKRAEFCDLAVPLYEKITETIIPVPHSQRSEMTGALIMFTISGKIFHPFTDTTNDNILKMAYLDVVTGYEDGTFKPNNEISRQEAATMLGRLMEVLGYSIAKIKPTFDDTKDDITHNLIWSPKQDTSKNADSWALNYIGEMQSSKIMGGVGNNRFDPHGKYTREQSIVTFMRIWNLLKVSPNPSVASLIEGKYKTITDDEYKIIFSDANLYDEPNNLYWRFAYFMALASEDTYEANYWNSEPDSRSVQTMDKMGFEVGEPVTFPIESIIIKDGDIKAIYGIKTLRTPIPINGKDKKYIIMVSFRGTNNEVNWRDNILKAAPVAWYEQPEERLEDIAKYKIYTGDTLISRWGLNNGELIYKPYLNSDKYYAVHGGFFNYADCFITRDLKKNIDLYMKKYPLDDCLFIITGHSLGGAMAELYALRLNEVGVDKNSIICYGIASPPLVNELMANYGIECMGNRIHKLCHESDIFSPHDVVPYVGIEAYTLASSPKGFKDSDIKTYYLANGNRHYIKDTYLPYILSNIK